MMGLFDYCLSFSLYIFFLSVIFLYSFPTDFFVHLLVNRGHSVKVRVSKTFSPFYCGEHLYKLNSLTIGHLCESDFKLGTQCRVKSPLNSLLYFYRFHHGIQPCLFFSWLFDRHRCQQIKRKNREQTATTARMICRDVIMTYIRFVNRT